MNEFKVVGNPVFLRSTNLEIYADREQLLGFRNHGTLKIELRLTLLY